MKREANEHQKKKKMKKKRTHWQMPIKLNPIFRLSLSGFSNGEVIVCVSLVVCVCVPEEYVIAYLYKAIQREEASKQQHKKSVNKKGKNEKIMR